VTLRRVQFGFGAATSLPIPSRYYFFGARLDGTPLAVQAYQIDYALGDMAPGEERTLDLDIIVRVGERSGAVARVYSGEDGRELTQQGIVIEPTDARPEVDVRLDLEPLPGAEVGHVARLVVMDASREVDTLSASVALEGELTIPVAYARQEQFLGEDVFGEKFRLLVARFTPTSPPSTVERTIEFEVRDAGCGGGMIALVAYVHRTDGSVARPALLADVPFDETLATHESCVAVSVDGVRSLGQGGFGPDRTTVEATVSLVAMLMGLVGFAAVGLGIYVVR
jgi:hypothetical protein